MQSVELITLEKSELAELIASTVRQTVMMLDQRKPPLEIMTKGELAEYLRCDVSKINRYMGAGLPFEQFGSTPRFRKSSIDAWLQRERI